jgi:hypothetical protein
MSSKNMKGKQGRIKGNYGSDLEKEKSRRKAEIK